MLKNCPNPIDEQDFQFKLRCRLKIFDNKQKDTFKTPHNLISCASRFNLLFVGSNTANLQIIQISSLENYTPKNKDVSDYPRRNISLPSSPKHVCVNCDNTIVAVVVEKDQCPVVIFYEVLSFYKKDVKIIREARISPNPGSFINEIAWNPSLPGIFTACKSDGSLSNYELKDNSVEINELPQAAEVSSFCWSPKGKQIAVGSKKGTITQYKPDLKAVKVIAAPAFQDGPHSIISLQWVSNYQFIGVYQSYNGNCEAKVVVVDAPKTGQTTFTNYDDVCYSGTGRVYQFYMMLVHNWNILMVASANGTEVAVLSQISPENWIQWILPDSGRAELPLSSDNEETFPVGFTFDTSSTRPYPWGESTISPCPSLMLLNHQGILNIFDVVNLKNSPSICSPPDPIRDSSGLNQFSTKSSEESITPQIKPTQQPAFSLPQAQTFSSLERMPQSPLPIQNLEKGDVAITQAKSKEPTPAPNKYFNEKYNAIFASLNAPNTVNPTNVIQANKPVITIPTRPMVPEQTSGTIEQRDAKPATEMNKNDGDNMLAKMIKEECVCVESELKAIVHKGKSITVNIGTDKEKLDLLNSFKILEEFIKEIVEVSLGQNAEVHTLKQGLILAWAWYEEALARYNTSKDLNMSVLLKAQPLDSATDKRYSEIQKLMYYIESQLTEVNKALDEQWGNFQDHVKKVVRLQVPTMESVFQIMVRQNAILKKQEYILKDIASRVKHISTLPLSSTLLKDSTYHLEESLKQLHITSDNIQTNRTINKSLHQTRNFTKQKAKTLKNILKEHEIVVVTAIKPQMTSKNSFNGSLLGTKLTPIKTEVEHKMNVAMSTPSTTSFLPLFSSASAFVSATAQPSVTSKSTMALGHQSFGFSDSNSSQSNLLNLIPNSTEPVKNAATASFSFTDMVPKVEPPKSTISSHSFTSGFKVASPSNNVFSTQHSSFTNISSGFITTTSSKVQVNNSTKAVTSTMMTSTPTSATPLFFKPETKTTTPTSKFAISTKNVTQSPGSNLFSGGASPVASTAPTIFSPPSFAFGNLSTTVPSTVSATPSFFAAVPNSNTSPSMFNTTKESTLFGNTSNLTSAGSFKFATVAGNNVTITPATVTTVISSTTFTMGSASTPKSGASSVPSVTTDSNISSTQLTKSQSALFSITKPTQKSASTVETKPSSFLIITPVSSNSASNLTPQTVISGSPSLPTGTSFQTSTFTPSTSQTFSFVTQTTTIPTSSTTPVSISSTVQGVPAVTTSQTSAFSSAPLITALSTPTSAVESSKSVISSSSNSQVSSSSKTPIFGTPSTTNSTAISTAALTSTATATNVFGVVSTTSGSVFGAGTATTSTSASGSVAISTGIMFGTSTITSTSGSIFGTTATSTPASVFGTTTTTAGNLFGTTTATTGNIFGAATTTSTTIFGKAQTTSSGNMFGNSTTTTAGNIFGTGTAATSTTGASIFGSTAVTTSASIFGSVTTTTSPSIFGSAAPTTTASIFGAAATTTSASIFGTAATTSASIFGTAATTTSASIFGTAATTTSAPIFGTAATTTSAPIFGTTATTTSTSIFGTAATTTSVPIFGTAATTTSVPIFGTTATTTSASIFGTATSTTSAPIFGTATTITSVSSVFGKPTTTATANIFGSAATTTQGSIFGSSAVTAPGSIFGASATTTGSVFGGSAATTQASIFGTPATSTSIFGTPVTTATNVFTTPITSSNVFGTPSSSPSVFGTLSTSTNVFNTNTNVFGTPSTSASIFGATSTSGFGSPSTFGAVSSSGNIFGSSATSSSFSFAAPSGASSDTNFGFGGLNVGNAATTKSGSIFGSGGNTFGTAAPAAANPFGRTEQKSPFGGTNVFGTPASTTGSIFGTNTSSTFGSNTPNAFGTPPFGGNASFGQQSTFGQGTFGSGSFATAQPGPFSGGGAGVGQSGFGASATFQKPSGFGAPPVFGGSPTPSFGGNPSFGGAPAFGGSPTFGTPQKVFGSNVPAAKFGSSPSGSPGFGNLANQNTIGFGNLAQAANTSSTPFSSGGSSFSNWR